MMNIYWIFTHLPCDVALFFNMASILSAGTHSLTQEINICGSQHLKMSLQTPSPYVLPPLPFGVTLFPHPGTLPCVFLFPSSQSYTVTCFFPLNFWTCGDTLLLWASSTSSPSLCLLDTTTLFLLSCPDHLTASAATNGHIIFNFQRTFFLLLGSFLADGK